VEEAMNMNVERFRRLATDFQWIHQGIGVLGGMTFFVGSILFLYHGAVQTAGLWLFIVGSAGMMVGNIGNALLNYERHKLNT
jgi:hypothetical protein